MYLLSRQISGMKDYGHDTENRRRGVIEVSLFVPRAQAWSCQGFYGILGSAIDTVYPTSQVFGVAGPAAAN